MTRTVTHSLQSNVQARTTNLHSIVILISSMWKRMLSMIRNHDIVAVGNLLINAMAAWRKTKKMTTKTIHKF